MLETRLITDRSALVDIQAEWERLVEHAPQATIFQTWAWQSAWWERMAHKNLRPYFLLAYRGKRLIGILPLCIARFHQLPMRRLLFAGTGPSDYLDAIVRNGEEQAFWHAVTSHLADFRLADIADLQQLRPDAALRIMQDEYDLVETLESSLVAQEPCPQIRLPETWDKYLESISAKLRKNLRRYEKLFVESQPDCTFSLIQDPDQLAIEIDRLFDLHQARWKARHLPGVLRNTKTQAFHHMVARDFLAKGWLRLHVAQVNGKTVAALYCFKFRDRYYYYLGGYDPAFGHLSIGTLLISKAIRQAIEESCTVFDFLRGEEAYKQHWCGNRHTHVNARLLIRRKKHLPATIIRHTLSLEDTIERSAKRFIDSRWRSKGK